MRLSRLAVALLAFALAPHPAAAGALSARAPQDDPRQILFDGSHGESMLVASAIAEGVTAGPGTVWFEPAPGTASSEPREAAPLFVLEDPQALARRFGQGQTRAAGLPSMLDLVLIICAPFVLPLITRRRTVEVEWPEDEDEEENEFVDGVGRASPM